MDLTKDNELNILKTISKQANVAEGPESIREVLLQLYREKEIKNKTLSQLTQIPVPTLSAIRGELIKAGILDTITSFTVQGKSFVEQKLGFRFSPCPITESFLNEFELQTFPETVLPQTTVGKLKNYLGQRPESKVELDQSMATFETQIKRLSLLLMNGDVEGRSILLLGDDDATSVVLSATGLAKHITVVDIDERILDFVASTPLEFQKTPIETISYDLRNPFPKDLLQKYDIVFTDPPYTLQGAKLFFQRGLYAFQTEGTKFYLSFGPKQPLILWNLQLQMYNLGFYLWKSYQSFNKYKGNLRLGQFSNLFIFKMVHSPEFLPKQIPQPYTKKFYTSEVKQIDKLSSQINMEFEEPKRPIGYHVLAEFYGIDNEFFLNSNELYKNTLELCYQAKLQVVDSYMYLYPPQGLSIIVTLAESHIGLHTWPEHDYMSLDVFICDEPHKADNFVKSMKDLIKPEKVEEIKINRGLVAK